MSIRKLLTLRELVIVSDEGHQVGPINMEIKKPEKILVQCADPAQFDALARILTGSEIPAAGA